LVQEFVKAGQLGALCQVYAHGRETAFFGGLIWLASFGRCA